MGSFTSICERRRNKYCLTKTIKFANNIKNENELFVNFIITTKIMASDTHKIGMYFIIKHIN